MYRSEKLRRHVASLPCMNCGCEMLTQAAHTNQGKGMGIKASDARIMALCITCHVNLDQPGLQARSKAARREFENDMTLKTLIALIEQGLLIPK